MSKTETIRLGFFWSIDDAEKAAHKHSFIRVNDSDRRSYRKLSGAEQFWSNPETEDEIYLIRYRICGKPDHVKKALANAGYNDKQILDAMKDAVTSKNYKKSKKKVYDEEIKRYKKFKEEEDARIESNKVSWETLLYIAAHAKEAHIVEKEKGTSPKRSTKAKTIIDLYKEIKDKEGKIIDVTNIREDGTGVKLQNRPSTERGQKVFLPEIPEIPIISKTQRSFMRGLEILRDANLFESDKEYQKVVRAVEAKFAKKFGK
jgi:hypothetical protein